MLGTLASAVVTQRAAERTKAREFEEAERRRIDDRAFEVRQALLAARRECYIEVNTASRYYHTLMRNCYHALLLGPLPAEMRDRLDHARVDHRAKYSVAQMVVPDDVLRSVERVNDEFNRLYGQILELAEDRAKPGESTSTLLASLDRPDGLVPRLEEMRTVMRVDLGTSAVARTEPALASTEAAEDAEDGKSPG
ncbi:hypothetical protein CLV63_12758 [Murinocardiopsis flavida]|uniref:Uncharacterized protein n=1 Tax=Murinocardiopsis flavida TaxID=645275 RepID=A0A2P8CW48_9ACTN|nr:hypothetical protein [Murinocardiopsis flavida]PSK89185.1 hypothetical protein CLV63_12758 [Murinocardiopsis flavida]